jgi:Ca2+-transporting ATPase
VAYGPDEPVQGLSTEEAQRRLAETGPNQVTTARDETLLEELVDSLKEPLVLLLLAIGVLTFVFGEWRDALIIFGVIVLVAFTEATVEWRAGRAVAALSAMAEPKAFAWRDQALVECPTESLVPGDLIQLRAGSRVPADATLVEASDLAVDESLITGESRAVPRDAAKPARAALLAGTTVLRGSGQAIVTRTGADSTLGQIATLVAQTKEPRTPLQRRMGELARALLWVALAASVLIPLIGIAAGRPPREMLLTGLSLAFATVPEELSVLIVVVLGLGSLQLARRGAIVRHLVAAETLGAVTVVCTDKTGTLTENRMALAAAIPAGMLGAPAMDLGIDPRTLRVAALATEATELDPIDRAIRAAGGGADTSRLGTRSFPFDRSIRLASGYVGTGGGIEAGVKGAPEAVLGRATAWRDGEAVRPLDEPARLALLAAAAGQGQTGRVLAVASRALDRAPASRDELERDLVFEGVLVLRDPVRAEVPNAVRALLQAGVRITVITGDQASTAAAVAREAGIPGADVLSGAEIAALDDPTLARRTAAGMVVSRAQPADKLHIVEALGAASEVVMVTGDGVNDAPALRAATVGVAMGRAGSDAARQAAQIVLTDDSFATLVAAVREGRRLYDNFRKVIRYYLAVKVALVLVMAAAAVLGSALPFTPVQIVILELFMDLGAALAFVNQPADADIMRRPPRDPTARFLDRSMLAGLFAGALTLATVVFAAFWIGAGRFGVAGGHTLALVAWMVGHAALGLAMAGGGGLGFVRGLARNPPMLGWAACAVAFAVLIVSVPAIGNALGAPMIPARDAALWGVGAALAPLWLTLTGFGRAPARARSATA